MSLIRALVRFAPPSQPAHRECRCSGAAEEICAAEAHSSKAMRRPRPQAPINPVMHETLGRTCAISCTVAASRLRVVPPRINPRDGVNGGHVVAKSRPWALRCRAEVHPPPGRVVSARRALCNVSLDTCCGFAATTRQTLALTCKLDRYVSDEEDEDDYEDDEEQEEEDEEAPAEGRVPPIQGLARDAPSPHC